MHFSFPELAESVISTMALCKVSQSGLEQMLGWFLPKLLKPALTCSNEYGSLLGLVEAMQAQW